MEQEQQRITIANALLDLARAIRRDTLAQFLDGMLAIIESSEVEELRYNTIASVASVLAHDEMQAALDRHAIAAVDGGQASP